MTYLLFANDHLGSQEPEIEEMITELDLTLSPEVIPDDQANRIDPLVIGLLPVLWVACSQLRLVSIANATWSEYGY
jgi:hypothetical protein